MNIPTFIQAPPAEKLRVLILKCIKDGLHTSEAISRRLSVKTKLVSARLNYLGSLGIVHGDRIARAGGGSMRVWHLGPGVDKFGQPGYVHEPRVRGKNGFNRRVIVSKSYPAVDQRDPLVAALFGAPAPLQQRNHP